jgi:hypothetical protein
MLNACTLRRRSLVFRVCRVCSLIVPALCLLACDAKRSDPSSVRAEALPGDPAEAASAARPLFSDARRLREAQSALEAALPAPIAALELVIRSDRMLLQARDPKRPKQVIQYEYRAGHVHGPRPVELRGRGALEDNLFPLAEADLSSVPRFLHTATRKAGAADAHVSHVVLRRNLPHTFDVRFRAHLLGEEEAEPVQADARGRPVGPS